MKDLLNTEPSVIKIQFDPKQGTVINGAKEPVVLSADQTIALIHAGESQRHIGSTDMNLKSSRAHTLFRITIESRERTGGDGSANATGNQSGRIRVSTLNLIDLAGSESAKLTNTKGERAREAKYINQSLLTLSLIIHKLSEAQSANSKRQHLPYRDSKLTRLLESALDGNARIGIVCTISPAGKRARSVSCAAVLCVAAVLLSADALLERHLSGVDDCHGSAACFVHGDSFQLQFGDCAFLTASCWIPLGAHLLCCVCLSALLVTYVKKAMNVMILCHAWCFIASLAASPSPFGSCSLLCVLGFAYAGDVCIGCCCDTVCCCWSLRGEWTGDNCRGSTRDSWQLSTVSNPSRGTVAACMLTDPVCCLPDPL